MFDKRSIKLIILITGAAFLAGCISSKPLPGFARKGDIINISVGGYKRNAGSQNFTEADFSVSITDSSSVVHTPQVKGVFKVFPDYSSFYSVSAQNRGDALFGGGYPNGIYPHDGALWISIELSDSDAVPLPLAVGQASLSVTSPKLTQTTGAGDGSYASFPLEIVPGTGTPTQADEQFQAYVPLPYLTIRPSQPLTGTVGGMQLEIEYDDSVTTSTVDLRAFPLNHDPNLSLIQSVVPGVAPGTKVLTVIVTNPNGFIDKTSIGTWVQGQSLYEDLLLAITATTGPGLIPDADLDGSFTVTANSYYVDTSGDQIPGVVPDLVNEIL